MFRQYNNCQKHIKETYKKIRQYQTLDHAQNMIEKYCKPEIQLEFWDAMEKTNEFIDSSDPDVNLPNIQHMYQVAEALRKNNAPEWLQITGLIHDLGKIIYLKGCDKDGTSIKEQWSVVGDTFVVGCQLSEKSILPELNQLNPDKYLEMGLYNRGCGMNNVVVSFGHDEYLYRTLINNKTLLPKEALYIIRFHSLYPWHTGEDYEHFENQEDREMKIWVKYFQKFDLYTKENTIVKINKDYWDVLLDKFGLSELWF